MTAQTPQPGSCQPSRAGRPRLRLRTCCELLVRLGALLKLVSCRMAALLLALVLRSSAALLLALLLRSAALCGGGLSRGVVGAIVEAWSFYGLWTLSSELRNSCGRLTSALACTPLMRSIKTTTEGAAALAKGRLARLRGRSRLEVGARTLRVDADVPAKGLGPRRKNPLTWKESGHSKILSLLLLRLILILIANTILMMQTTATILCMSIIES